MKPLGEIVGKLLGWSGDLSGEPVPIKGFENYAEETVRTYRPVDIRTHSGTKYSLFTRLRRKDL